jgi:hypothetical protein
MASRLNVCSAINFDGGGSSAMWVRDRLVNRPADGLERPVGDHLAVILQSDSTQCDVEEEAHLIAATKVRHAKLAPGTTETTTTTTTTVVTTTTSEKAQTSSSTTSPPHH